MAEHVIVTPAKTYMQHGSMVVVIPIMCRTALKLDPGEYVLFSVGRDTGNVTISKFETKEKSNAKSNRNTS